MDRNGTATAVHERSVVPVTRCASWQSHLCVVPGPPLALSRCATRAVSGSVAPGETDVTPTPFTARSARRLVHSSSARAAALAWVLGFVAVLPAAAQSPDKKLDQHLREHASAADNTPTHAIVTLRTGAKARAIGRWRQRGLNVTGQHEIVEAVSVTLPANKLRALAAEADVLAVSTDA